MGIEILDQVDRVVAFQFGDGRSQFLRLELVQHHFAKRLAEIGEDLGIEGRPEKVDQWAAQVRPDLLDQVGKVGGMKAGDLAARLRNPPWSRQSRTSETSSGETPNS